MRTVRPRGRRMLIVATALMLFVAACGGSSSDDAPTVESTTTEAPATTATEGPATTQAPATTEAPATTGPPATTPDDVDAELFAVGEELFLSKAGGVGCAACHGTLGLGDVGIGPNIQGKTVRDIKTQFEENPEMEFMRGTLDNKEFEAVALYLNYLKENFGE